jgi:IclR family acetate operon transcriptional repressor
MSGKTSTLLNALDILELLGRAPQLLQLKDIALQLDLPESTTHRLLASMVEKGYVRQRGRNGAYGLGWKVVTLARSFGSGARIAGSRPCHRPWQSAAGASARGRVGGHAGAP